MRPIDTGERADRSHWPPGVNGIGVDGLNKLGVDAKGRLHWDGKPVEVGRRLDLTRGQQWLAYIVAIGTVLAAVGSLVQAGVVVCQAGYIAACRPSPAIVMPARAP